MSNTLKSLVLLSVSFSIYADSNVYQGITRDCGGGDLTVNRRYVDLTNVNDRSECDAMCDMLTNNMGPLLLEKNPNLDLRCSGYSYAKNQGRCAFKMDFSNWPNGQNCATISETSELMTDQQLSENHSYRFFSKNIVNEINDDNSVSDSSSSSGADVTGRIIARAWVEATSLPSSQNWGFNSSEDIEILRIVDIDSDLSTTDDITVIFSGKLPTTLIRPSENNINTIVADYGNSFAYASQTSTITTTQLSLDIIDTNKTQDITRVILTNNNDYTNGLKNIAAKKAVINFYNSSGNVAMNITNNIQNSNSGISCDFCGDSFSSFNQDLYGEPNRSNNSSLVTVCIDISDSSNGNCNDSAQ